MKHVIRVVVISPPENLMLMHSKMTIGKNVKQDKYSEIRMCLQDIETSTHKVLMHF